MCNLRALLPIPLLAMLWLGAPAALRADKASHCYERGVSLRTKGKLEQAKHEFEEALRRKPDYRQARILLALTHFQLGERFKVQGDLDRARAEIQEALRLEPDEAYWHYALAVVLYKQGNTQDAAKERAEAARLSPEDTRLAEAGDLARSRESETTNVREQQAGPRTDTTPFRAGGNVSPPIPKHKPEPRYSQNAREVSYEGTTVLWIVVNAEGNVEQALVVKPLGLGLDQEALHAVRTWKFKPAMRGGKPVSVRMTVEITFRCCP